MNYLYVFRGIYYTGILACCEKLSTGKKLTSMDNKNDTGHPDRDEIDIHEDYEVRYWTKKWGITADQKKARTQAGSKSVRKIHDAAVRLGYMKQRFSRAGNTTKEKAISLEDRRHSRLLQIQ